MAGSTSKNKANKAGLKIEVSRKKKESELKDEPAQSLGLCVTCIHLKDCGFRRDVSQSVIECDEFDVGPTSLPAIAPETKPQKSEEEFKGLCINCDLRHECSFLKPVEGVWHCEEYV